MGCILGSAPDAPDENDQLGGEAASKGNRKTKGSKTRAGQPTTASDAEGGKPKKMRSPSVVYKIQIEHFISPHQEEQLEIDLRAGIRDKSPLKLDYVLQQAGQLYQSPLHPSLLAIIIRVSIALYEDCTDHENGQIILQEGMENANYQMQEDKENGLLPDDDEALDEENKQLQEIRELLDIMRVISWAWSSGDSTPDVDLEKWIIEPRPLSVDSFSRPDMNFGDLSDEEILTHGAGSKPTADDNGNDTAREDYQSPPSNDDDEQQPLVESQQPQEVQPSSSYEDDAAVVANPAVDDPSSDPPPPSSSQSQEEPTTPPELSSRELCDLIRSSKTSQSVSDDVTKSILQFLERNSLDPETNDAVLEWCEFLRLNEKEEAAVSLEMKIQERREAVDST